MTTIYKDQMVENTKIFSNFSDLSRLHQQLQNNLKKLEFDFMTPIQKFSIGYISDGYDLMGCAETGSGKTIAFLLPIVNEMLYNGPPSDYGKK